jgi:hypothetical protein
MDSTSRIPVQVSIIAVYVQALGWVALAVGAFLTLRRVAAAEEAVKVDREAHVTESFGRAIDQLGSENLVVRLGGIYALERIAWDYAKLYWPIMETLTTFVRLHAPLERDKVSTGSPRPDVQAILTVIGRRNTDFENDPFLRLDLSRSNLSNANLFRANLENTHFEGSSLKYAILAYANLRGAILWGTDLECADISGADLRDVMRLESAQLRATIGDKNTKLPPYVQRPNWPDEQR